MTTVASKPATGPVEYFRAKLEYEISPEDLRQLLSKRPNNLCVVDVRDAARFDSGHVPGARNVPVDELLAARHDLPKDETIVTCGGDAADGLSLRAALELARQGFQVQHLIGGLAEWSRRGFPIETAPSSAPSQAW